MTSTFARLSLSVAAACCAQPVTSRAAEVVKYYHSDAIGNVRAVTDRDGNVLERFEYYPFGEDVATPSTPTHRRFTGKERDDESGLDYFGARHYLARTARFTSVDPVYTWSENLADAQRWNRYAYARNSPLRYVDPDGRVLRTTAQQTMDAIAGDAKGRVRIVGGILDASGLTESDRANNEGAALLQDLASRPEVYSYQEGPTVDTQGGSFVFKGAAVNLDRGPYPTGRDKKASELPADGVKGAVAINPAVPVMDTSWRIRVPLEALAFHELAEAFAKGTRNLTWGPAHADAGVRERKLLEQRPDFSCYAVGSGVATRDERK